MEIRLAAYWALSNADLILPFYPKSTASENLTFQLFPEDFMGFNQSENELRTVHRGVSIALCLRTELVCFGQRSSS